MYAVNRAVFVDDSALSVPVTAEVKEAINLWQERHIDDLAFALEPFGLSPFDLLQPEFERIVKADELV